jgi:hypothetical protein
VEEGNEINSTVGEVMTMVGDGRLVVGVNKTCVGAMGVDGVQAGSKINKRQPFITAVLIPQLKICLLKFILFYLTDAAIAAICSGVFPQQPPTTRAPRLTYFLANSPICPGVTS